DGGRSRPDRRPRRPVRAGARGSPGARPGPPQPLAPRSGEAGAELGERSCCDQLLLALPELLAQVPAVEIARAHHGAELEPLAELVAERPERVQVGAELGHHVGRIAVAFLARLAPAVEEPPGRGL